MGCCGGFIGSVVDAVADVADVVVDAVSDAGSFIDDNVIQPALDDPIGTAAKVAAVATGNPQLLPLISGTQAVAAGGDLGDVAKSVGTSYVAGEVGGTVGGEVAGATGSDVAGAVAGGAAAGGTGAAISGGDVGTGLLTGGINAGISQGVNAAVDTGYNLLSGANAANNAPVTELPTTGNTNMALTDIFNPFADTVSYTADTAYTPPSTGDAAAYDWNTINNYYDPTAISAALAAGAGQSGTDIASQIGSSIYGSAAGEGATSWTPADSIAAATAGVDQNTLTSLLKQFGVTAVKSLLGVKGGTTGTGTTAGTATGSGLLGGIANYYLSNEARQAIQSAAQQASQQELAAAQQAQQQASFTPVGMTTRYGQSQFTVDPTTGKLTSAGYTASPELAAQRERLFGLGTAALPTTADTQAVQQQYIAQQQGLLAPGREQQLAQLRNRQYQRGTTGLATGGTVAGYAPNAQGLMATNPEMAAYYNSLAQADAALAANAPTYAQNLLNQQIATGTGLFGAANTLEGYAQQPLTLASSLANLSSTAGAKAGQLGLLGTNTGINTALQGNIASATGQLGQQQALAQTVNPLLQSVGNSFLNWIG